MCIRDRTKDNLDLKHPIILYNSYNVKEKKKSVISPVKIYNSGDSPFEELLDNYKSTKSMSYGTASNLSQMFPVMSASATINDNQYFDGGIYDNSGLSTIREIYSVLARKRDIISPEKKIVILYLENSRINLSEEDKSFFKINNSIKTLVQAASGSIFHASSVKHKSKLMSKLNSYGDTLRTDIYLEAGKVELNRWIHENQATEMIEEIDKKSQDIIKEYFSKKQSGRDKTPASHSQSFYFEINKYHLDPKDEKKLGSFIKLIKPYKVTIIGYTDDIGPRLYNEQLAESRASALKDLLCELNIKEDHIFTSTKPNLEGSSNFENQSNRRVEMIFEFYSSESTYFAQPM